MKQYPLDLKIDYSEVSNRSTAFIIAVLMIPVVTIITLISSYAWLYHWQ
ncbi:MAG: hypothetical protein ABGY11_06650 [Candidatus Thioglobus sp.]|jgi:hypothetical protein